MCAKSPTLCVGGIPILPTLRFSQEAIPSCEGPPALTPAVWTALWVCCVQTAQPFQSRHGASCCRAVVCRETVVSSKGNLPHQKPGLSKKPCQEQVMDWCLSFSHSVSLLASGRLAGVCVRGGGEAQGLNDLLLWEQACLDMMPSMGCPATVCPHPLPACPSGADGAAVPWMAS